MQNFHSGRPTCVALGNFDGIHPGHKAILESCLREALKDGLTPLVWSFQCHPEFFLQKDDSFGNLISLSHKKHLLGQMGFDRMVFEDFLSVCDLSPEEFCEQILIKQLQAKKIFCGFNFRFGKGGTGDASFLERYLLPRGIEVFVSAPVCHGGSPVSSTRIRALLTEGKIKEANALLGRPYSISFPVSHGKHLGTKIGFPTLNQEFPAHHVVPKKGVYFVEALVDNIPYGGVCNVGSRPTVDRDSRILAETYLFDFNGDLYGKEIQINFFEFLRPEIQFDSVEALTCQIAEDTKRALALWKEKS